MKKHLLFLLCIVFTINSCKNDPIYKPEEIAERTTLIYLAANNNLANEGELNIQQIEKNLSSTKGNIIIFATLPNKTPTLYHIKPNPLYNIADRISISQYPNLNSSDPYTLKTVIQEMKEKFSAKSYGLILWSHATGWIPPNIGLVKLKSFGNDAGREMDLLDLKNAIPSNTFDFIMFDACSMASIEVLYELRDKTKYFIASPGEVISQGMPYHLIVDDLLESDEDIYRRIAAKYYDYYNSLSGTFQSATVSVVNASKLQNIAESTKRILEAQNPLYKDFHRNEIQRMDFDRYSNPLIAFDFLDFMETNYDTPHLSSLKFTLDEAIIYKANTANFNGFPIKKFSGLTCYIPHPDNETIAHEYYRTLQWYTASGFDLLF